MVKSLSEAGYQAEPGNMNLNFLTIFAVYLCHLTQICTAEFTDVNNIDKEKPFRMGKVNIVWEKARKKLKGKKLTDLYADLVVQDRKFKELKVKLANNEDPDGLFEAQIRRGFGDVLRKYNLLELFQDDNLFHDKTRKSPEKLVKPELRDEKLNKLWEKATFEDFSEAEMDTLKEELSHHQMKLDEYNSLKTDYEILKDNVDNSLDNLDEQEEHWRTMESTKRQMKDKHSEIRDNYDNIKRKVDQGRPEDIEFSDPRVYHLWALAQKSGMTPAELRSIKKELTHFQHRIKKAEVIQNQVNKSEQKLKSNDGMIPPQAHKDLVEKAKQYHAKVDKYHEDLKYRIERRLDEL